MSRCFSKKVVHVVEATATGTLSMVAASANALAIRGSEVTVIYSPRPETPADLGDLFEQSVELLELRMDGPRGLANARRLRALLVELRPDIVHLHSSFAGFLGRIATIGVLARTRFFYSPHCISVMRTDIRVMKFVYAFLERVGAMRPCRYLACSESEQHAIRRWVGETALVVENAADVGWVEAFAPKVDKVEFVVVTSGGIRAQKGVSLFARIAKECTRLDPGVKFVWIGDGDPGLRDELESSGVEVFGWQSRSLAASFVQRGDVYLSTSRWEGMPVSIIEAMALGTPVIATSCPGNVDVIQDEVTGFLFDDEKCAVSIILRARKQELDLGVVAVRARLEALDRFSVTRFAERLEHVYFSH